MMDAYKITKLFEELIQRMEQQNLWRKARNVFDLDEKATSERGVSLASLDTRHQSSPVEYSVTSRPLVSIPVA
jgi:hypothetical protein